MNNMITIGSVVVIVGVALRLTDLSAVWSSTVLGVGVVVIIVGLLTSTRHRRHTDQT